jgi:Malectin domain/Glycosyl hydrolase catalytic core
MKRIHSASFAVVLLSALFCAACSSGSHTLPSASPDSASRSASASTVAAGPLAVAVNAGGPAAGYFSADKYNVGYSGTGTDTNPINVSAPNSAPAGVYADYRTAPGTLTYNVTGLVPNTPYSGYLHFDEPLQGGAGRRVESVSVGSVMVAAALDIYAAAGGEHKAYVLPFSAVSDSTGTLQILLTALVNDTIISGFEIYSPAPGTPSPTPSPSPLPTPASGGAVVVAINAGGGATGYFTADKYSVGYSGTGTDTNTINVNVPHAAPQAVYQSYRTAPNTLTYNVTGLVPKAPYTGYLHFEEPVQGSAGKRVQSVSVGGVIVAPSLDIYAAAGGEHRAYVIPFAANADATGTLQILLTKLVNAAIISGFEIDAIPPPAPSTPAPSGFQTPAPGQFGITAFGGLKGITYSAHTSGDSVDYAEILTIDFNSAVNLSSFNSSLTVTPATPWTTYPTNYGKRIELTIRKTPGTVYSLTFAAGMSASTGATMPTTQSFSFTTPAKVVVPARAQTITGQPYRYGFLVHPYATSLAGSNAAAIAGILGNEGAGFVRIDYTGAQIMPTSTTFNWAPSDAIVSLLASHNITLMPILEQYNAAPWQNNFEAYPAIYSSPTLYANFVSAVVAHLRATAPQVTRIELFNEPNTSGWWTSPTAQYAATDGSATAVYMLAAYRAAKAANPGITIVGPALTDGGTGNGDPRPFLTTMYANGCRTGTCWDVLSVHPYAWADPTYAMDPSSSSRWNIYQDLQAIAVANGDPKPHVMLTEWAFSTVDQADGFDPQVQARYMAEGLNLANADPSVDGVVWTSVNPSGTDFWSLTSITDPSLNLLPAAGTFRSFAVP